MRTRVGFVVCSILVTSLAAQTVELVKDINLVLSRTQGSYPHSMVRAGNWIYFTAIHHEFKGPHEDQVRHLYRTSGLPGTLKLLKISGPYPFGPWPKKPWHPYAVGSTVTPLLPEFGHHARVYSDQAMMSWITCPYTSVNR